MCLRSLRDPSVKSPRKYTKVALRKSLLAGLLCLFFVIVKIHLLWDQKLTVLGNYLHDSRLFIDLAQSLSKGDWLGPYHERTLIKGPFYPLWIAAMHKLHVPLLKSQHALYVLASGAAAYALATQSGPRAAAVLFIVLLFNPASYGSHTGMVLRESVSSSLALLVAAMTLLSFRDRVGNSRRWPHAMVLGVCLGFFWLTREESLWILPFYVFCALHFLLRDPLKGRPWKSWIRSWSAILAPLAVTAAVVGYVSAVNKAYYGIGAVVELKSRSFREAYGALTRVHPEIYKPGVPVPRDVRLALYQISPSFRELRPFLERKDSGWISALPHLKRRYMAGELDEASRKGIDFILSHDVSGVWRAVWDAADKEKGELYGPWFVWALREAAAQAGHHTSAVEARAYYEQLAREIRSACDAKTIPCAPHHASLLPPWRPEYLRPLFQTWAKILHLVATHQGIDFTPSPSTGDEHSMTLFRALTHEEPVPVGARTSGGPVDARIRFLKKIAVLYRWFYPWLFFAALLTHGGMTLLFFKKVLWQPSWGFAVGVLASHAALALILAYVHITSFPGMEPRYMAPLYPLSTLYIALVWSSVKGLRRGSVNRERA